MCTRRGTSYATVYWNWNWNRLTATLMVDDDLLLTRPWSGLRWNIENPVRRCCSTVVSASSSRRLFNVEHANEPTNSLTSNRRLAPWTWLCVIVRFARFYHRGLCSAFDSSFANDRTGHTIYSRGKLFNLWWFNYFVWFQLETWFRLIYFGQIRGKLNKKEFSLI